jgi:hypothetical protein
MGWRFEGGLEKAVCIFASAAIFIMPPTYSLAKEETNPNSYEDPAKIRNIREYIENLNIPSYVDNFLQKNENILPKKIRIEGKRYLELVKEIKELLKERGDFERIEIFKLDEIGYAEMRRNLKFFLKNNKIEELEFKGILTIPSGRSDFGEKRLSGFWIRVGGFINKKENYLDSENSKKDLEKGVWIIELER